MSNEQGIQLAVPLMLPDGGGVAGAMVLRVTPTDMRLGGVMLENVQVLGLATPAAVLLLTLAFRYAMPLHELAAASKIRLLLPLAILMLAQGVYAAYTLQTFRDVWLQVTQDNPIIIGRGLQHENRHRA